MSPHDTKNWKETLRKIHNDYKLVITLTIIAIGFLISFAVRSQTDIISVFVGQLGIFISGVVAVTFLYDLLIKDTSNKIFLDDMQENLVRTLDNYNIHSKYPIIHEKGRLTIQEKVAIIKETKQEYIEVALAMRTFTEYFTRRNSAEFKDEVVLLLDRGVDFKFYILNPDSEIAKNYAIIRNETDLLENIQNTKTELLKLKKEFEKRGCSGKFEIYFYENFPYFSLTIIDKDLESGRALVSNYLPLEHRAEMPVIEITKKENSDLMKKYVECLNIIIKGSQKVGYDF
jgi:hypothetical protein